MKTHISLSYACWMRIITNIAVYWILSVIGMPSTAILFCLSPNFIYIEIYAVTSIVFCLIMTTILSIFMILDGKDVFND